MRSTIRGAPTSRKKLEEAWLQAWEDLCQDQIRRWIERIPVRIEEIIRLERGTAMKKAEDTLRAPLQDAGALSRACIS